MDVRRFDPDCQVLDHYGPTETTVGVLMNWIERDLDRLRPRWSRQGAPLANADMHILDSLQGCPRASSVSSAWAVLPWPVATCAEPDLARGQFL